MNCFFCIVSGYKDGNLHVTTKENVLFFKDQEEQNNEYNSTYNLITNEYPENVNNMLNFFDDGELIKPYLDEPSYDYDGKLLLIISTYGRLLGSDITSNKPLTDIFNYSSIVELPNSILLLFSFIIYLVLNST